MDLVGFEPTTSRVIGELECVYGISCWATLVRSDDGSRES
jgi:hypothetical protein